MQKYLTLVAAGLLAACQTGEQPPSADDSPALEAAAASSDPSTTLAAVLDAQPDEAKARYQYRNPKATVEFFGIEPGMTVLEGLPGGGWYSKILLPYLGEDGRLIGAAYALEMYALFPFASPEFMARQQNWTTDFVANASEWGGESGASAAAFHFGSMPEGFAGTVDVAFFPRVMHNAANFQNRGSGDYLKGMLGDVYTALKSGGVLGIVQHEARPDTSDEFATGGNGYLKKAWLIEQVEAAGFEFVAESDINENPNDQPGPTDVVWRLPPRMAGADGDEEKMATLRAIGESNRMTLKFRKP